MPLHIEHRPRTLDEIVGNKAVKDSLESIFTRKSDFPHAYLFHGPTGTGKTTMARIVASLLKCDESSIEEYNVANLRGIDTVRAIGEYCQYMPLTGNTRVYILDEIHRQTKDAKEGLLKLLEDPPPHVYFILCTTNPEELPPTLRGRCHTYQTKPLKSSEMMGLLKTILVKEKVKDYPETILKEIIHLSEGLPRNALVMLDAVIDILEEDSAIAALSSVALSDADTKELCQSIMAGDPWDKVRENLKIIMTEYEPEKIRQAICGYLLSVLLNSKQNDRVSAMLDVFSETNFYTPKLLANQIYVALKMK
jgi:DNA polymerase-3 subunit gamma/tau